MVILVLLSYAAIGFFEITPLLKKKDVGKVTFTQPFCSLRLY